MLQYFGGVSTLDYMYIPTFENSKRYIDLDVSKGWPTAKLNSFSWAYFKNNKITHSSVPSRSEGEWLEGGVGLGQESIFLKLVHCFIALQEPEFV